MQGDSLSHIPSPTRPPSSAPPTPPRRSRRHSRPRRCRTRRKRSPGPPQSLSEAAPWLIKPFPQGMVELKPTATSGDKSRALASPYVDMRAYYARLDKICGPEALVELHHAVGA